MHGRAGDEALALGRAADELRRRTMRVLRVAFLSSVALDLAMALALVVIALRYGGQALAGTLASPGTALFVLLLVPEFFAPLRAFAAAYQERFHASAAADALATLPPLPPPAPVLPVRNVQARGVTVAFENVTLTWDPARGPALDGLNFRVPAGEMLVLIGPSGAGKSTVMEILLGFVRPQSGHVTFNGADIATLVPQALSRMTAWIGQRPILFAGSIRDNIRFARPEATDRRAGGGGAPRPCRRLHRRAAARARYPGGGGRLRLVRRSGAAHRHRPCLPEERSAAAARRAHRASRPGHRGRGAGQPEAPDGRPHRNPGKPFLRSPWFRRKAAGPKSEPAEPPA